MDKLLEAFEKGQAFVCLEPEENLPFRLSRFRRKHKVRATGKHLGGVYCVVFWDRLMGKK